MNEEPQSFDEAMTAMASIAIEQRKPTWEIIADVQRLVLEGNNQRSAAARRAIHAALDRLRELDDR